ncbi:MAG: phenylalanine--tRNA ligase subunit beta [Candidatus Babeliaceae bacterium]|nr:phenylalanine--tRNA ligase subunit beta [Candidatus Babeliaceae bacterium]
MKLSLSWVFTHIKKNPFLDFQSEFEKGNFFERMGATIAEIEQVEKINYPLDKIFLGTVIKQDTSCTITIAELHKEIILPNRRDLAVGDSCLVFKQGDNSAYLTLKNLYAEKEGFVPAIWVTEPKKAGAWKENISAWDYILTFDNKALTHRPDLWGHRGFAREIAALYGLELVPEEYILAQKAIRSFTQSTPAVAGNAIGLENHDSNCKRFAGLSIQRISSLASFPDMLFKLCAIDAKPINGIVDTTNYVMYDIGQPMHAFDADQIAGDVLKLERAIAGEKLVLLDGSTITLTQADMVVRDKQKVLGLAGIMGGKDSSVTRKTTGVFIESASYAAAAIRKSSIVHKIRTESSTRFEKSLDPLYNTQAITRFLHLLDIHDVSYQSGQAIMSLGEVPKEKTINFTQAFISDRIGTTVSMDTIHTILSALGFGVKQSGTQFTVTVPSFRATKDITLAEDIVEEIARFIGFNNLAMQLPSRVMKPFSIDYIMMRRALKRLCAFGFNMHEVSNYAFYDNQFINKIGLNALTSGSAYTVAHPVSEHWTSLVSSLIPHFFKNVEQNASEHDRMAFFEMNTIWKKIDNEPVEQSSFAGIWYQATEINFYEYKEKVAQLFKLLCLPVLWRKPATGVAYYYHPYQTAELVFNDIIIGYAGCVRPDSMRTFSAGHAFVFEIDLDTLLQAHKNFVTFAPLSMYQPVTTDISLLVPFSVTVDALEQAIALVDARIYQIQLIDYFEKPEWISQRAVTLRYKAVDQEKTFSKQEIDLLRSAIITAVQALGVSVR